MRFVQAHAVLELANEAARAVAEALSKLEDWGLAGTLPGQYRSDLVADQAALDVLHAGGLAVLSEESGLTGPRAVGARRRPRGSDTDSAGSGLLAVLDPVDGSTNASRGIPWFATSICVLDDSGPLAAVVVNQASGVRYEAIRDGGATRDGRAIHPSKCEESTSALVGLSGYPRRPLRWRQFRALGAAALDLCAVADGTLDGFVDCLHDAHGSWDYLGGMLVCREAGAHVADASGRDLVVRGHEDRRTPVAAATASLLAELVADRRRLEL